MLQMPKESDIQNYLNYFLQSESLDGDDAYFSAICTSRRFNAVMFDRCKFGNSWLCFDLNAANLFSAASSAAPFLLSPKGSVSI